MDLKTGIEQTIAANTSPRFQRGLRLQQAWEKVAPEKALRHTDNIVESKKEPDAVAVFVDTPHYAAELSMSKEYYRQMLEIELGEKVTDVFFVVSKETGIRKEFAKRDEARPWYIDECDSVPLDEGELAYAQLTADSIEDESLKEAFLKALVSDLEWKKGLEGVKSL